LEDGRSRARAVSCCQIAYNPILAMRESSRGALRAGLETSTRPSSNFNA
jgi:hypothetical protein